MQIAKKVLVVVVLSWAWLVLGYQLVYGNFGFPLPMDLIAVAAISVWSATVLLKRRDNGFQ